VYIVEHFGDRVRRVDYRLWDGLLALAVLTYALVDLFVAAPTEKTGPSALAVVLVVGATAPLAWRRRAPLTVAAIVVMSDVLLSLMGYETESWISVAICAYTAAAYTERRPLIRALVPLLAIGVIPLMVNQWKLTDALLAFIGDAGIWIVLGRLAFNRRLRVARDRDLAAQQAVTEERARMTRELHDVVAHHMSVIVIQAAAARAVADRDPAAAGRALCQIEVSGRAGLTEMRRLLEVLKSDEPNEDRAPQPGLGRLGDLLDTMRASGLPVERIVEGTPHALSSSVDLSAYRIVQEALTNTLKHAGDAHARVLLRFEPEVLEIEVVDDGRGGLPRAAVGGGRGLVGMRERVQFFGGTLESGPRPGGGFLVRARLPLPQEASA
jgi:signal transduction histidine kinase